MPGAKGPRLSAVGISSPSSASSALASPRSTLVKAPSESAKTSTGAVTTGATSSEFGSLFSKYSSRLLRPSPSASPSASAASFGSKLFSTSKRSSIPSPSVSFSALAETTVTLALFCPCRSSASTAVKVTTVSPKGKESGALLVTSNALPEKSSAVTAEIKALICA